MSIHVTAAESTIPGQVAAAVPTAKKPSTGKKPLAARKPFGDKMTGKTSSGSKTSKCKAGDDPSQSTRKKQKEDEDNLEDQASEIAELIGPLIEELEGIIRTFVEYKDEPWYKDLVLRSQLIPMLPLTVTHRLELVDRPELKAFRFSSADTFTFSPDKDVPDGYEYSYNMLLIKFRDLDRHRRIAISSSFQPPAPSTYCLYPTYKLWQLRYPQAAVRDGCATDFPLPLELFHHAFRVFTYWATWPLPLLGSSTPDKRKGLNINLEDRIRVFQAVNELLQVMPCFFSAHDDRLRAFRLAFQNCFRVDEGSDYQWVLSEPADQGTSQGSVKYRVDAVYRHKRSLVPIIFLEVKLEEGIGGNAFWQNHHLYQAYVEKNPTAHFNGAPPMFFVQLAGTKLGIAGGFCDAIDKPPVALQLGSTVNLQEDRIGYNLTEGIKYIWALTQAIQSIPIGDRIEVTDVLFPGVVYLTKYHYQGDHIPEPLRTRLREEESIVKIIYSGLLMERYGLDVHAYLAQHDMAPNYYLCHHNNFKDIPGPPLEVYYFMEYLRPPPPPPLNTSSQGWLFLYDLEQKYPEVASSSKDQIMSALLQILDVLKEKGYVHGDLRMNNLMVHIEISTLADGSLICKILSRLGSNLPYIKVIDFDWAGLAGEVNYPPHRNIAVSWPGQAGFPIMRSHDQKW
ncbi:hypothetical protein CPB84DRAFT_1844088 [Gymnopilus junonius]|uniref:Uncharacterized protein n=1 Tax=Gymnopilus junonius TaxID=109634 RepID=A0A9P5NVS0_GYMJU|nr:hypothetical protein CPB84DRAFT_1844088 [Gymnopilus junonius]